MEKWLPTILTLVAAGGSLAFLVISMRVKNAVQDSVEEIAKPLSKEIGRVQKQSQGLETKLVKQAGDCQGKFLSREDYDRLERMREQHLQLMRESVTRLEENLREALRSLRME